MSEVTETLLKEVSLRLETYHQLLLKWQRAINLVSPSTLPEAWERHFEDSLQLLPFIFSEDSSSPRTLLDLGSGAGFPGLVLAIASNLEVTLVESDQRKCEFMRNVSRETKTPVTILNQRIEEIPPRVYDVITSRALAPLDLLLDYSFLFVGEKTRLVFLKGEKTLQEIEEAQKNWIFQSEVYPSRISRENSGDQAEGHTGGHVLVISHVKRK